MRHPACFLVPFSLVVLFRLVLTGRPAAHAWTTCDLSPPGATSSHATAVNEQGQVVGWWTREGEMHAFLWSPDPPNELAGSFSDLGLPGFSQATGINAAGQVVGWMHDGAGAPRAFLWTPLLPNGPDGILTELPVPGSSCMATAINDEGQVVGHYAASARVDCGFLWSPDAPNGRTGTLTPLGTAQDRSVRPDAINNRGQVVGQAGTADGKAQGFLWTPDVPNGDSGSFTHFFPLGSRNSEATAINDLGEVIGCMRWRDGTLHAFLWSPGDSGMEGAFMDLNGDAGCSSRSNGINNRGQVVGWSDTSSGDMCATLFTARPGGAQERNDSGPALLELSRRGNMVSEARAINSAGQVVGSWQDANGNERAALWQPPQSLPAPLKAAGSCSGDCSKKLRKNPRLGEF